MEMTVQHRKIQLVSGLFDDSAENIVIYTEFWLKVSTIHIVSDQWIGVEEVYTYMCSQHKGLNSTKKTIILWKS